MPSGFRPERVPGSQAERAPAPALWAGEKSREQSVSAERAEAGAARRLAGAREETRSLPPAITPRPALPPPLGTRGPQAELAPPPSLLLRGDLGGEAGGRGAPRHYCLYGSQQKGYFYGVGLAPNRAGLWPLHAARGQRAFASQTEMYVRCRLVLSFIGWNRSPMRPPPASLSNFIEGRPTPIPLNTPNTQPTPRKEGRPTWRCQDGQVSGKSSSCRWRSLVQESVRLSEKIKGNGKS